MIVVRGSVTQRQAVLAVPASVRSMRNPFKAINAGDNADQAAMATLSPTWRINESLDLAIGIKVHRTVTAFARRSHRTRGMFAHGEVDEVVAPVVKHRE